MTPHFYTSWLTDGPIKKTDLPHPHTWHPVLSHDPPQPIRGCPSGFPCNTPSNQLNHPPVWRLHTLSRQSWSNVSTSYAQGLGPRRATMLFHLRATYPAPCLKIISSWVANLLDCHPYCMLWGLMESTLVADTTDRNAPYSSGKIMLVHLSSPFWPVHLAILQLSCACTNNQSLTCCHYEFDYHGNFCHNHHQLKRIVSSPGP